jgi:hypothetical protein
MENEIKLFSVIALLCDIYDKKLQKGQVGTIVEQLATDTFEVEFCDKNGQTIVTASVNIDQILVLHYDLIAA